MHARWLFVLLLGIAPGCTPLQAAEPDAPPDDDPVPEAPVPPAVDLTDEGAELTCPPGTIYETEGHTSGDLEWCQRADGTRHGTLRFGGELVMELCEYEEGVLVGCAVPAVWFERRDRALPEWKPLECPPGSEVWDISNRSGYQEYCRREDGILHGPARFVDTGGRAQICEYADDKEVSCVVVFEPPPRNFAATPLDCPPDTREATRETGTQHIDMCVLPDGTQHGASRTVDPAGALLERCVFVRGSARHCWHPEPDEDEDDE